MIERHSEGEMGEGGKERQDEGIEGHRWRKRNEEMDRLTEMERQ